MQKYESLGRTLFSKLNAFRCLMTSHNAHTNSQSSAKELLEQPTITLLPGDGVWPELFDNLKQVFKRGNIPLNFEEVRLSELVGAVSDPFDKVVDSFSRNKVGIKGSIAIPAGRGELKTVDMSLRRKLDLFAKIVEIRSLEGVETRHANVDFVVIRETTEGEFSALEHEARRGVVESLKIITKKKSDRIAKLAFDYATKFGRKKVTAVHKANIMKLTDGQFLESCLRVSKLYPNIEFNSIIIDNCCMQLVANPQQFDVMVMPNLYGEIVANVGSGLVGGAGLVAGASFSHDVAVFESGSHHPYAAATGLDIANPLALLLASAKCLRHVSLERDGNRLEQAILAVIRERRVRTRDMGGFNTASEMVEAVIDKMAEF